MIARHISSQLTYVIPVLPALVCHWSSLRLPQQKSRVIKELFSDHCEHLSTITVSRTDHLPHLWGSHCISIAKIPSAYKRYICFIADGDEATKTLLSLFNNVCNITGEREYGLQYINIYKYTLSIWRPDFHIFFFFFE